MSDKCRRARCSGNMEESERVGSGEDSVPAGLISHSVPQLSASPLCDRETVSLLLLRRQHSEGPGDFLEGC